MIHDSYYESLNLNHVLIVNMSLIMQLHLNTDTC